MAADDGVFLFFHRICRQLEGVSGKSGLVDTGSEFVAVAVALDRHDRTEGRVKAPRGGRGGRVGRLGHVAVKTLTGTRVVEIDRTGRGVFRSLVVHAVAAL